MKQKLGKRCARNDLAEFHWYAWHTPRDTEKEHKTWKHCVHNDLADFGKYACTQQEKLIWQISLGTQRTLQEILKHNNNTKTSCTH